MRFVSNNKIRLQPLFNIDGQEVVGYEALYSRDQSKEARYPSAAAIFKSIAFIETSDDDFRCFINMTDEDAINPQFAANFLKALDRTNINRSRIVLEVNENTAVSELEKTKENLRTLCSSGVQIALDDFGTNFSTLEFISKLPLDVVKIDRKFIENAPRSRKDLSLLKFCVEVSHDIGCTVVAEGIETQEEMECVAESGADIGQGFIFTAPAAMQSGVNNPFIPLTEFMDYLSTVALLQRSAA